MSNGLATLLLVEDDDVDIMAVKRVLSDLRIKNPLVVATDGLEALDHLNGTANKSKIDMPCIVLLDLNMPRMNGFQFLEALQANQAFNSIDVFVLTTSESDKDVVRAYDFGVKGYVVKADLKDSLEEALDYNNYDWAIFKPIT